MPTYRIDGISTLDIMEGVAALESLKMAYQNFSVDKYLACRNKYYPGKGNSVYRRMFDTMRQCCSAKAVFDLLPVIGYLSLWSSVPGRAFEHILQVVGRNPDSFVGLPASEIVKKIGYTDSPVDIFRYVDNVPSGERHIALFPLLAGIAQNIDLNLLLECLARPSTALPEHVVWLRPPLVVGSYPYNGKKGLNLYGVVTEKRQVQTMIVCAAFVAAADALVNPSERHVPCQTSNCLSFGSSLCSGVE